MSSGHASFRLINFFRRQSARFEFLPTHPFPRRTIKPKQNNHERPKRNNSITLRAQALQDGLWLFRKFKGVPCILKFSFDFGDVLFSDDMGGWLAWHECLFEAQPPMEWKMLVILDDQISNGCSYVRPWRLRWTTAVVTRSILSQSFSFIREVNINSHRLSTLLSFTKITGKQRHW